MYVLVTRPFDQGTNGLDPGASTPLLPVPGRRRTMQALPPRGAIALGRTSGGHTSGSGGASGGARALSGFDARGEAEGNPVRSLLRDTLGTAGGPAARGGAVRSLLQDTLVPGELAAASVRSEGVPGSFGLVPYLPPQVRACRASHVCCLGAMA